MSVVTVVVENDPASTYVWFHGPGSVIHEACRAARARRSYDARRRAIGVPRDKADDVIAALELQSGGDVLVERWNR